MTLKRFIDFLNEAPDKNAQFRDNTEIARDYIHPDHFGYEPDHPIRKAHALAKWMMDTSAKRDYDAENAGIYSRSHERVVDSIYPLMDAKSPQHAAHFSGDEATSRAGALIIHTALHTAAKHFFGDEYKQSPHYRDGEAAEYQLELTFDQGFKNAKTKGRELGRYFAHEPGPYKPAHLDYPENHPVHKLYKLGDFLTQKAEETGNQTIISHIKQDLDRAYGPDSDLHSYSSDQTGFQAAMRHDVLHEKAKKWLGKEYTSHPLFKVGEEAKSLASIGITGGIAGTTEVQHKKNIGRAALEGEWLNRQK